MGRGGGMIPHVPQNLASHTAKRLRRLGLRLHALKFLVNVLCCAALHHAVLSADVLGGDVAW